MLPLTVRQKNLLRSRQATVALFMESGHPDGTFYVWAGSGNVTEDGQEWLGCGLIAGISGMESSAEPSVSEVSMILTGVPGDVLNVSDTSLKGYQATIYHGIMREGRVIDGLIQRDIIDLDTQTSRGEEDGSFTIVVTGQSGYHQLEHASRLLWSPERQKSRYPTDVGLDGLAALEDKRVDWTRT